MRTRILAGLITGLLLFGIVSGSAASLGATVSTVGAVSETVSACDLDGVSVDFVPASLLLDDVTVGGIADLCDGLTLYVTIGGTTVSGAITASGSDDATVTLDFTAASLSLASLTAIDVVIV